MKKQFLDSGKIVGTHGIKGDVRIEPWCDSPEFLCAFKKLYLDENGHLEVIIDPRAKSVCPMAKALKLSDFDALFIKNIKRAFSLLIKNPIIKAFMKEYSSYIDEFARFF